MCHFTMNKFFSGEKEIKVVQCLFSFSSFLMQDTHTHESEEETTEDYSVESDERSKSMANTRGRLRQ